MRSLNLNAPCPESRCGDLEHNDQGCRSNPDPGLGGSEACEQRQQGGNLRAPAHRGERSAGEECRQQRLYDGRPRCEKKHRVEHEQRSRQPGLAPVACEPIDAREGGQPDQGAQDLQGNERPQPEHAEDGARQKVVAGEPRVLHSEQRILQVPGRGKVGRDKPVGVAVLERLRHLCGQQEQDGAEAQQDKRRGGHTQPGECAVSQAAKCHNLEEVDCAEAGERQEAQGEKAGIDRNQALVRVDCDCSDHQRCHSQQGLSQRSWIADMHVVLVSPLLTSLDDVVLWGAHEFPPAACRPNHRDDDGERHAGAHHLAEDRWQARPPRPTSPCLRDHESDPRRRADDSDQNRRVGQLPGKPSRIECEQEHWVAGELSQHQRSDAVRQEMDRRLELHRGPVAAAQNGDQQPECRLEAAGCPARLLAPVSVDGYR